VPAKIWARKSIAALEAEAAEPEVEALTAHDGVPFKRSLSAVNLIALGIGAIIGAGIFVLTGHAAATNAARRSRSPSSSAQSPAPSPACATPNCHRPSRSPAAPTPTRTPRWESSSPGSSAGI
jgi:hypothetical protein